jgi:ABC-type branched-subunit amino acid transport system ATPase component
MDLVVERLTAGYGDITVLRDVSISVTDGEILAVLGRNGMGKTTLIRSLAGLLPVRSGAIRLAGEDITRLSAHERARRGITTIVQGRGIFPRLTVWENLEMGRIAGGGKKPSRMNEVFEYFPRLEERMHQQAGTLSGGEQQMLAIARALMTVPKLILLDEPSDGVMPLLLRQIGEIMVRINREQRITMVIVEQNVPLVLSMTDHFAIIEKGRVVAEGPRDVVAKSEVMKEYLAI